MKQIALIVLALSLLCGCSTIPNGGHPGDLSKYGKPGPVLDTVHIGRGMLVEDLRLGTNGTIQAQVSKAEIEDYQDPLLHEQILTIGHFNKVTGSGFAKKENIYYRKRIWHDGQDVFSIGNATYLVKWKPKTPNTLVAIDTYILTVQIFVPNTP